MQSNFETMTNKELIAYALSHRDEIEPLRVLYDRRTPDDQVTIYPAPCTPEGIPIEENMKMMEDAIHQRIQLRRDEEEIDSTGSLEMPFEVLGRLLKQIKNFEKFKDIQTLINSYQE